MNLRQFQDPYQTYIEQERKERRNEAHASDYNLFVLSILFIIMEPVEPVEPVEPAEPVEPGFALVYCSVFVFRYIAGSTVPPPLPAKTP